MLFYDVPDAYDLYYGDSFKDACQQFYRQIFSRYKLREALDCSVGTGQMTIPLAKLGVNVTGSDINPHMIQKARRNFAAEEIMANLLTCDFLEITQKINRKFDAVLCSGNSLAHVHNAKLKDAIFQMDAVLKPGGVLYIDSRNWDNILKRQQRFYLYNPLVRDRGRVNFVEVWDYNKDNSMVFNFLITEEIDNKIVSKRQFYTLYYPFSYTLLTDTLREMGYMKFFLYKLGNPALTDTPDSDWYSLVAEKPLEQPTPIKGKR